MNNDPIIIAHRGASFDAPENTLAAIDLAWQQGADAVEFDVHLTTDNKIVLIHDEDTFRTCGQHALIKDQTYRALYEFDFGRYKGEQWAGERIPVLEDVLQTVPSGKKVFIEIKCGLNILPILEDVLAKSALNSEQITLMDFDLNVITIVKKAFPHLTCLWIAFLQDSQRILFRQRWILYRWLHKIEKAGLDGLNVSIPVGLAKMLTKITKRRGKAIFVWTINEAVSAAKLQQIGVKGIITDRPGWLREQLLK